MRIPSPPPQHTNTTPASCEWYFGQPVRLIMFKKEPITHCVVVPAHSTIRSSSHCGAADILISSSGATGDISINKVYVGRAVYILHHKVQDMIGNAYSVSDSGSFGIDESKLPATCLLRDGSSSRRLSTGTAVAASVPVVEQTRVSVEEVAGSPVSVAGISPAIRVACDGSTATAAAPTDHAQEPIRALTPPATGGEYSQEPPSPTILTPTTRTTQDARDRAAQVTRDIVREEVDRALAAAVANLARLLSGDVGRAT